MTNQANEKTKKHRQFRVTGQVSFEGDVPAPGVKVIALDRDLRSEQTLGDDKTDSQGRYSVEYSSEKFLNQERGTADLVVKAVEPDGSELARSAVLFNAPDQATIDLTIPLERKAPPSLFDRIGREIAPLLGKVAIKDLEEDDKHQDVTFLAGETGFEKRDIARFVLAHQLVIDHGIAEHFWFGLLGAPFFEYVEGESLKEHLARATDAFRSLDGFAVRKALGRSLREREIPQVKKRELEGWIDAFLGVLASLVLGDAKSPTFTRSALEEAGIGKTDKQIRFAQLFQQHSGATVELFTALEREGAFKKAEISDLQTSFQLGELLQGDFPTVKMIKEEFRIRKPGQIRKLARQPRDVWVELVERKQKAGEITPPLGLKDPTGNFDVPEAELFANSLDERFREAFPTDAFAGGLNRALAAKGVRGIKHGKDLSRVIDQHPEFDLPGTALRSLGWGLLDCSVSSTTPAGAPTPQFDTTG